MVESMSNNPHEQDTLTHYMADQIVASMGVYTAHNINKGKTFSHYSQSDLTTKTVRSLH